MSSYATEGSKTLTTSKKNFKISTLLHVFIVYGRRAFAKFFLGIFL